MFDIRKRIAQIGDKENRLTVMAEPFKRPESNRPKAWYVRCLCTCGKETVTTERAFFNGGTKSCGCLRNEASVRNGDKHRHKGWTKSRTHGESKSLLYGLWTQMKGRCTNPDNGSYVIYGARGIRVCQAWSDDYVAFRDWAYSNGYEIGLTLDRIDPDKGYDPSNCRWVTLSENSRHAQTHRTAQIAALKARVQELETRLSRYEDVNPVKCLEVIDASQTDR